MSQLLSLFLVEDFSAVNYVGSILSSKGGGQSQSSLLSEHTHILLEHKKTVNLAIKQSVSSKEDGLLESLSSMQDLKTQV